MKIYRKRFYADDSLDDDLESKFRKTVGDARYISKFHDSVDMAICNATRTLQRYFFQQIVLHVCTPWVEYDAAELHGSPTGRWGVESSIRTLPSAKPTGRREHDGEHGRVHGAAAHRMTHFWGRLPTSDGPAGFFLPHAGFSSVLLLLRLHREP